MKAALLCASSSHNPRIQKPHRSRYFSKFASISFGSCRFSSDVLPSYLGKRKYGGQTSKRDQYSAATSPILSIFDGPKISNRLSSECRSFARFQFISESVDVGFRFLESSGCARRRASFYSGSKRPDRIQ
jgi:hypothetical protein